MWAAPRCVPSSDGNEQAPVLAGACKGGLSPAYFKVNFASETLAPDS